MPHFPFLIFTLTLLLSLPCLLSLDKRSGWDYTAYIQQASAVYNGERDYTRISSNQGPCYYPAGHLWHYYWVYWLHMQVEWAETAAKVGYHVVHAIVNVYTYEVAKMMKMREGEA